MARLQEVAKRFRKRSKKFPIWGQIGDGDEIRITAQLLDAINGAHLWADRFDGTLEDVFELQDNVASSVAGVIEPTLEAAEHRRSIQRPTNDLTAYDLCLQARVALKASEREGTMRALELAGRP